MLAWILLSLFSLRQKVLPFLICLQTLNNHVGEEGNLMEMLDATIKFTILLISEYFSQNKKSKLFQKNIFLAG